MVLTHLKIASLNCCGLNDRYKRVFIFDYFRKSSFSVILLQETKTNVRDENRFRMDWHNNKIFINSSGSNSAGGCLVLINNDHIKVLNSILACNGRCIVLDIELDGCRYHLINTYFPIENSEKKSFIISLYPLISSNYPIIWAGDFNLTLDTQLDRFPAQKTKDPYSYNLSQLIKTFDLKDVFRELFPSKRVFTFKRGTSKSRIDRAYVSSNVIVTKYEQEIFSLSDHDLIKVDVIFQNNETKGRGIWKNKSKMYAEEDFGEKFENFWEYHLKNSKKEVNDIGWWLVTKKKIKKFLTEFEEIKKNGDEIEIRNLKISLERKKNT